MRANKRDQASVVKSAQRGFSGAGKSNSRQSAERPSVSKTSAKSAALYQDPGGGYNRNFTFPQK